MQSFDIGNVFNQRSVQTSPALFRPEWGSGDEWQWLGQTLDAKRALLVRETEPDSGALCKFFKAEKIYSWSGDPIEGNPGFSLWQPVPEKTGYDSLGSYVQLGEGQPKFDGGQLNKLRGIRKDLVVQVPVKETPVNLPSRPHNGYD
jgi:hypothetical protein